MTTLTQKHAFGFAPLNVVSNFVHKIEMKLAQRDVYKRTLAELDALGERELADLGFAYGDIHNIARQAAGMV